MLAELREAGVGGTTDNVVLFVCDSLRYDALPESISELGVTYKTIAASGCTRSSLPSIMSGQYPSNHRVWDFSDQLQTRPALLEHSGAGFNAETMWTHMDSSAEKPSLRMHRVSDETSFEDLSSPFIYVEHHKGGHAPYNISFEEYSPGEYYTEFADRKSLARDHYEDSLRSAAQRFRDIYRTLSELGELENTLLIFTSDHGELLGEPTYGGFWDHCTPLVPEIVNVPSVFAGAGLPKATLRQELLSGVDIAPTALAALGKSTEIDTDGHSFWTGSLPNKRVLRSEFWSTGYSVGVAGRSVNLGGYKVISFWNSDGGVVVHRNPRRERFVHAHVELVGAPRSAISRKGMSPSRYRGLLRTFLKQQITYGAPDFERDVLEMSDCISFERQSSSEDVEKYLNREQLKHLGYLE